MLAEPERQLDLDANEILRIVEARPALFIFHSEPIRADQHKHHVAGGDLLLDHPHKVLPRPDSPLDIHEQALGGK